MAKDVYFLGDPKNRGDGPANVEVAPGVRIGRRKATKIESPALLAKLAGNGHFAVLEVGAPPPDDPDYDKLAADEAAKAAPVAATVAAVPKAEGDAAPKKEADGAVGNDLTISDQDRPAQRRARAGGR